MTYHYIIIHVKDLLKEKWGSWANLLRHSYDRVKVTRNRAIELFVKGNKVFLTK